MTNSITSRYSELRQRDRRKAVRDPDEHSVAVPLDKKLWADPPTKAMAPVPVAEPAADDAEAVGAELPQTLQSAQTREPGPVVPVTSPAPKAPEPKHSTTKADLDAKRVVGDSREIFGEVPKSRGVRGIFRR